jgi:hypothetical protein
MSKFVWGRVLNKFDYDFDGKEVQIIKYHPWAVDGCTIKRGVVDESITTFHCEEIHQSDINIFVLILAWLAYKQLGLNEGSLVCGIAKALDLYGDK